MTNPIRPYRTRPVAATACRLSGNRCKHGGARRQSHSPIPTTPAKRNGDRSPSVTSLFPEREVAEGAGVHLVELLRRTEPRTGDRAGKDCVCTLLVRRVAGLLVHPRKSVDDQVIEIGSRSGATLAGTQALDVLERRRRRDPVVRPEVIRTFLDRRKNAGVGLEDVVVAGERVEQQTRGEWVHRA